MKGYALVSDVAQKIQTLEKKVKFLEETVRQLTDRLNYLDRERQRLKSDVGSISTSLKRL